MGKFNEQDEKILFKVSIEPKIDDETPRAARAEAHIENYDDVFELCFAIHKLFESSPEIKELVRIFGVKPIADFLEENSVHIPDFNELLKHNNNK